MAATWWDQFLLLVVQTDGAAASLDLEDTSATDVYLPLIMDSQIASVSGYFYFRLLIFEIYRKLGPGNNIERLYRKDKERVRSFYAPRHPRALHFHASFNENDSLTKVTMNRARGMDKLS